MKRIRILRSTWLAVTFLISWLAADGFGQPVGGDSSTIMIPLRKRMVIKARDSGGTEYVGRFTGFSGDSIYLSIHRQQIPAMLYTRDIDRLQVRKRATIQGVIYGGFAGGASGLIALALWNKAASGGDMALDDMYVAAGFWGAIAGGLVGAGVGSLFPKWSSLYERKDASGVVQISGPLPDPIRVAPTPTRTRPRVIGPFRHVLSLFGGRSEVLESQRSGSYTFCLGYQFRTAHKIGLGVEGGFATMVSQYGGYDSSTGYRWESSWRSKVFYGTAIARISPWAGAIYPYGLAGIGMNGDGRVGIHYTGGGGIGIHVASGIGLAAEARWHHFFGEETYKLLSFRGGLTYSR